MLPFPVNTIRSLELLRAIRDANYHHGGLSCLCILQLDSGYFAALQTETIRLCETQQPSNVSSPEHITNWTHPSGQVLQYSLLNTSGRFDDFTTDHNLSIFGKRFHSADRYPVLAEFIAAFPHAVNFRVNVLGSGAKLAPHEEHSVIRAQTGTVGLRIRLHLPVVTNPSSELILDGNVYHLEPGFIYFINHGCFHAARNLGDQTRIHLVWDMLLTLETYALLFNPDSGIPFPARRLSLYEQKPSPLRQERMGAIRIIPAPISEQDAQDLGFIEPQ